MFVDADLLVSKDSLRDLCQTVAAGRVIGGSWHVAPCDA
ncbi:MAG: hypothetical protein M2R45_01178 [Verrucomicrobia subdivision 3 bacterium]|nr:hypothetical protein [Limisphaerales bacterium]MCS1415269.1 hypothetical protein [Limisphaerales bacterium]